MKRFNKMYARHYSAHRKFNTFPSYPKKKFKKCN